MYGVNPFSVLEQPTQLVLLMPEMLQRKPTACMAEATSLWVFRVPKHKPEVPKPLLVPQIK